VLVGIDDGLHAVPQSKLHQDSGHVDGDEDFRWNRG
jgi:hypothetical protein